MTEPKFRQPETLQLAPDALLFINGSDIVVDSDGNSYQIRNDITDISTSLAIDSNPGTAGFTIVIPDHSIRRATDRRYDSLKIMSEVEIYFRGRFPKEENDILDYPYYPAFWGIITSISENYSDGMHSIQVSCAGILRFWEITQIAINPSLAGSSNTSSEMQKVTPNVSDQKSFSESQQVPREDGTRISPWGNIFTGDNIPTILLKLSQITTKDFQKVEDFFDTKFTDTDKIEETKANIQEMMEYWVKRLDKIARGLRIYALDPKSIETEKRLIDGVEKEFIIKAKMDLQVLSSSMQPYLYGQDTPPVTQSGMKTYLDIINELKEFTQFEFFMDVTGELIFKPPFYNMNVITNMNSVIRDLDILNWNFIMAESEIVTRMEVTTSWINSQQSNKENYDLGIAIDYKLAKQYGIRAQQRTLTWLQNGKDALGYAKLEMNRINALAAQGSVTITGRPELRLGYPVYVPSRDSFYYVTGIDHSFNFGGSFTTTLTLRAERKKLLDPNTKDPIKNQIFRNIGEVQDISKTIQGGSLIDNINASNNYMLFISDPCRPSKSTQPSITQPNFLATLENISSMKQGEWKSFKDIKIDENFDEKTQFQTTDGDGYELIPFFKYGKDFNFNDQNFIEQMPTTTIENQQQTTFRLNASKALSLKPQNFTLIVNPNNTALTLDNEDASMLSIYNTSNKSKAFKGQNLNPKDQDRK
jgi:hypothetical protein